MEQQKITFSSNNTDWDETENFAEFSGEELEEVGGNLLDTAEDVAVEVKDTLEETYDLVVDETKILAPKFGDTIRSSSKRLNEEDRVISFIPNAYLYFGIMGLAGYLIVKKLL